MMRCDEAATARARTISLHRAHDVTRSLCACADVMRVRFTMMSYMPVSLPVIVTVLIAGRTVSVWTQNLGRKL